MRQNLKGVPETLLIPLWARAAETRHPNPIIRDEKSVEMMEQIDYDFSKFNNAWLTQTGVAVRTEILDKAAAAFIGTFPDAVVINIGCGLDTRCSRLDNGSIRWYDLDLPEPIRIRKLFFTETQRYKMIPKSVFDSSWLQDIDTADKPVLLLAEGIFMYFTEQEVKSLMKSLVQRFSGAQMFFETMAPTAVKYGKKHETVKKTDARFQWGIKSGREMEGYHPGIRFAAEWNYFDYHHERWKGLRWLTLIPAFKNNFNNRIVHILL